MISDLPRNLAELRRYILMIGGRMIKWSTTATQNARQGWIRVTIPPVDPANPAGTSGQKERDNTDSVRLIQQYGFRSRPIAGSEIVIGKPRGGPNNEVALGTDNLSRGPSDLAEGECAIYSSADRMESGTQALCRVRLGADGKIAVDSKTGQDVVVNQGTKKVARVDDQVNVAGSKLTPATFAFYLEQIRLQIIAAGGGNIGDPPSHMGDIATGADRFKA